MPECQGGVGSSHKSSETCNSRADGTVFHSENGKAKRTLIKDSPSDKPCNPAEFVQHIDGDKNILQTLRSQNQSKPIPP